MARHTPQALALFPHLRGTSYTEDGVGVSRDHHAAAQAEEQKAKRKFARAKKLKKLARKKARDARKVSVSVRVTAEVRVGVVALPACRCWRDPKTDALAFEDNPYAMAYRRRPLY